MPPKKQQKKQIIPIFQPTPFWQYSKHSQQTLDKVQTFLTTFTNQLKQLLDLQKSIQYNYQIIVKKIGTDTHPTLSLENNGQRQQSEFPSLKSNDYGQKYLVFSSVKIDSITLKILTFLSSSGCKLNTLKFSNNQLDHQINQLKKFIQKQGNSIQLSQSDQLTSLYFQWNSLKKSPNRSQFFTNLYLPNLQHLILRQCQIGNQTIIQILNKISQNPNNNLLSLDLYGNKLTVEIFSKITKFLEENKKIEFLGLAKNQLNTPQFLRALFNSIGEIPLTEEDYANYKLKQKQRDQINQRNKKRKKGAPEQPVPFLLQIKQTQKGRFFVKNTSLKVLNLSTNSIKDSVNKQSNVQLIKNFVQNQGKAVQMFLEGNSFTKKSKQMFKFYQNIYF